MSQLLCNALKFSGGQMPQIPPLVAPLHTRTSLRTREPQIHHEDPILNTMHIALVPGYLNM